MNRNHKYYYNPATRKSYVVTAGRMEEIMEAGEMKLQEFKEGEEIKITKEMMEESKKISLKCGYRRKMEEMKNILENRLVTITKGLSKMEKEEILGEPICRLDRRLNKKQSTKPYEVMPEYKAELITTLKVEIRIINELLNIINQTLIWEE